MVQLPALLCIPIWLSRRGLMTLGRVFALVPVVMSWAHYLMPPLAELGLLGLATTAWFSTAIGSVLVIELSGAIAEGPTQAAGGSRIERPGSCDSPSAPPGPTGPQDGHKSCDLASEAWRRAGHDAWTVPVHTMTLVPTRLITSIRFAFRNAGFMPIIRRLVCDGFGRRFQDLTRWRFP